MEGVLLQIVNNTILNAANIKINFQKTEFLYLFTIQLTTIKCTIMFCNSSFPPFL